MVLKNIIISKMLYDVKGDNASLIIRNIAPSLSKDINLSAMTTHQKLEDLLRTSMIGIGDGVAVFDWVSDKVEMPYILCAKLDTPTEFPAVDKNMIDIVLVLVSPEKYGSLHLQYLSRLTRMFREEKLLTAIRSVTSVDGMVAVLSSDYNRSIAA